MYTRDETCRTIVHGLDYIQREREYRGCFGLVFFSSLSVHTNILIVRESLWSWILSWEHWPHKAGHHAHTLSHEFALELRNRKAFAQSAGGCKFKSWWCRSKNKEHGRLRVHAYRTNTFFQVCYSTHSLQHKQQFEKMRWVCVMWLRGSMWSSSPSLVQSGYVIRETHVVGIGHVLIREKTGREEKKKSHWFTFRDNPSSTTRKTYKSQMSPL